MKKFLALAAFLSLSACYQPAAAQDRETYDDLLILTTRYIAWHDCKVPLDQFTTDALTLRVIKRDGVRMEDVIDIIVKMAPTIRREMVDVEAFCHDFE